MRLIGYFTTWGVYERGAHPKDLVTSGTAARLTHLNLAFGSVVDGRCARGDAWAETGRGYDAATSVDGVADVPGELGGVFGQLRKLKAAHPHLRLLWSFGGAGRSAGFGSAAANPRRFAESCQQLLDDPRWAGLFDGIDIDWEYPGDTSGYPELMAALRERFPNRLVTSAVPASPAMLAVGGYGEAEPSVDWYHVMSYDYAGWWTPTRTAPHSALDAVPGVLLSGHWSTATIDGYRSLGIPADKLLLGVGFYGRGWTGVSGNEAGAAAAGPAPGTVDRGMEDYRTLATRCPQTGVVGGTAFARCGSEWWSYDTPQTLAAKARWAREAGLGGVFFWEFSGDTDDGALVSALHAER